MTDPLSLLAEVEAKMRRRDFLGNLPDSEAKRLNMLSLADAVPDLAGALRAALAEGEAQAVAVRDAAIEYAERSLAACRKAVDERTADIGKREENASIMPMLREQAHAWREKVSSYEVLLDFLRSLPLPTPALDGMLAAVVARVEAVDPLAVAAEWEDGNYIASAVHQACVQAAKARGV